MGGQSGAEVVEHLLGSPGIGKITWVTSRGNLFTRDDSSFINVSYTPSYSQRFHSLPLKKRRTIVDDEKLTSDGISAELSNRIYETIYHRSATGNIDDVIQLLPAVVMKELSPHADGWHALLASHGTCQRPTVVADRVVLATGFEPRPLAFIDRLLASASMEGGLPVVKDDYSVQFEDNAPGQVYLQNRSPVQSGLQSVNLSLVAYRNGRIINSLLRREYYLNVPDRPILGCLGLLPAQETQNAR